MGLYLICDYRPNRHHSKACCLKSVRTTGDLVSALQPLQTGQNDIVISSETKNPYTEHKIDVLDRLDQDLVIGTGLKGLNELETYLYNLIIKEYNNLMY